MTYSFLRLSRECCLVFRDITLISQDESRILREGGNLPLSGTVVIKLCPVTKFELNFC